MAFMNGAIIGLVAATCMLCVTSASQFPKFAAVPSDVKDSVVPALEVIAPTNPKNWYASWNTSMRMTLLGNMVIPTFVLNCFTEQLSKGNELSEIQFCFNSQCETLTADGKKVLTLKGPTGDPFLVTLYFSTSNGGSVTYKEYLTYKDDITTKFYCSVKNSMASVKSNTLEIIDLRRRFPTSVWLVENVPPSSIPKNGPIIFRCFESNGAPAANEPPYTVQWGYCTKPGEIQPAKCAVTSLVSISQINSNTQWPIHIRKDGSLFIPYFSDNAVNYLSNRMLVCSLNQRPVAYYKKPLEFNTNEAPDAIKTLEMVRPIRVEKVSIFNSPSTSISFPCNFKIGVGDYTIVWKFYPKIGGTSQSITERTRNEQGVSLEGSNSIHFEGPFSDKTVGRYECMVTWISPFGGINQKVTGSYDVEVQFFPTVSDKMVPLKYVVDGSDGVVQCLFEGLLVTPSLAINGVDLKTKDGIDIMNVNNLYKKVMAPLTVEVTPLDPKPGQTITYTAKKMSYRTKLHNLPSTHSVDCIGTNEVGSVLASTLLQVVPKPELVPGRIPSSLNCSECSAAEAHTIRCEVSNAEAINKSGVVLGQYWMLGNQRVDDLFAVPDAPARKYLVVLDDKSLLIKKIDDEEFKKSINDLGKIECVLTLGYPATVTKLPPEVKTSGVEKGLFFISSRTDMQKDLTTPIKLTNIAPPTLKTGSMMWVIPVILALIVILIIIGATYYCCRQRTSGEEYNVDAKEKQQGNDPEVEVAEKEAFPVFERPEDGPIRGSRASLDDSIHVGSDDEDEVLAEYDVDIGKFDEEGSFIGQYAVNDNNTGTGNRRLPYVGNSTDT